MLDQMTGYAELVLDVCTALKPDGLVLIDAEIEHAPLARALAEAAYAREARYVDIRYDEPHADLSRVRHAARATLPTRPYWLDSRYQTLADGNGVLIEIAGPSDPGLLAGEDPGRVRLLARPELRGSRTVVPYPTQGWARSAYGVPDVIRLWTHLRDLLRLDDPDPATAWRARTAELDDRAGRLTALALAAIQLTGPGTDLTVGLASGTRWTTARRDTPAGRSYLSRLPGDRLYLAGPSRVDGRLHAAGRPELRFPGPTRVAEVALVAGTSPVERSAITCVEEPAVRTDIAIGGPGLTVSGLRPGRRTVPLLVGDEWQI